jgi:hypothetical protein
LPIADLTLGDEFTRSAIGNFALRPAVLVNASKQPIGNRQSAIGNVLAREVLKE